jgi:protein CpxP
MSARLPTYILFATLLASPAFAAAPPAHDQSDDSAPPAHDVIAGQHVEGNIAFLHAELGITPEQEDLWSVVADAMREDVHDMSKAERQVARQPQHETAVQYLQNRTMFAQLRAQGEVRFYSAFTPLYNVLSTHQKQVADDLLINAPTQDPQ